MPMIIIEPHLISALQASRSVVVMMCGVAGTGKTTLSKQILNEFPGFTRLSKDEIVYQEHGIYGQDFEASDDLYMKYLDEAENVFRQELSILLSGGKCVVLDRSFYAREDRQQYKKIVEDEGSKCMLVYFRPSDKQSSWARVCKRAKNTKDANSAYDITEDTFDRYYENFEIPADEGEVIIEVA